MQKHQNIKALFFLGIFSILLLHQVVPHWHHEHQEEYLHSELTHEHHSNHHHHETLKKDNSKKGILDWFFEMHVHHTNATIDLLVLTQTTVKKITVEKESVKTLLPETIHLAILERDTSNKRWYHPPDKLQNTYFPNCSLRGPPSLG